MKIFIVTLLASFSLMANTLEVQTLLKRQCLVDSVKGASIDKLTEKIETRENFFRLKSASDLTIFRLIKKERRTVELNVSAEIDGTLRSRTDSGFVSRISAFCKIKLRRNGAGSCDYRVTRRSCQLQEPKKADPNLAEVRALAWEIGEYFEPYAKNYVFEPIESVAKLPTIVREKAESVGLSRRSDLNDAGVADENHFYIRDKQGNLVGYVVSVYDDIDLPHWGISGVTLYFSAKGELVESIEWDV